ncbi:L,D-transpeptidase family protein [Dyadobacter frigoris]|uniref:L,D-TPase catalytic domain-containing protein n=1 Tax=Dyadobacter frigoris TaxID=2576211 RepID=A0A4U6CYM3_9BACT|nr:L,D-transpeptidase family protein [Dyadobacter frigoris]TKT86504.1 hypothetical protein FDK13_31980 [Dyadobacter frigoris]
MLRLTIPFFMIGSLFSQGCERNNNTKTEKNTDLSIGEELVKRDTTINIGNAYNDLFLDSSAVEKFIKSQQLNDSVSFVLRSFYNTRNFEYAWFCTDGLIEQSLSFRSLYKTEDDPDSLNKSLETRLDRLRVSKDNSVSANDPVTIKTELQLSLQFIRYALVHFRDMGISPSSLATFIPVRKKQVLEFADEILDSGNTDNKNYAAFNKSYGLLKVKLGQYRAIKNNGGWPVLGSDVKKYRLGTNNDEVRVLKKRLQLTGELIATDTNGIFSTELESAVNIYQANQGEKPTEQISLNLLKNLNIPVEARIQQIILNMQRMRWMPDQSEALLIKVNIPEFVVYVDSAQKTLFKMDVVVGVQGHNTTMFSGNINQVVFSPYWNIPPSIVRKEIIPGLRRDKNYLKNRNMERVGSSSFRQKPGPRNALGKVKFLFPNSFNIYMHDTPQKGFFDRDKRSLSHGCIRLSDARKMAIYLLHNYPEWTPEKIDKAMDSGHERFVKLKPTVPVIITYYTAWVDKNGSLHFANDIYQHDKTMAKKMFTNPQ